MKARTKIAALAVAAVALVGASVLGTMAYLTSQAAVTNTFTVGNVQITLDETAVNLDGTAATPAARVDANKYKLMPGHTYIKDPIVHVAQGSEDAYLFVKVENGIAAIEAGTTIAAQLAANGWTPVAEGSNVFAYADVVSAGDNIDVFASFTISGDVIGGEGEGDLYLGNYADAQIVVTAYAIQADGFANATAAWTAAGL